MEVKKNEKKEAVSAEKTKAKPGKYFYAVGRRKTAIARVFLYPEKSEEGDSTVNKSDARKYFTTETMRNIFFAPLEATGLRGKMKAVVSVSGGGKMGQAQAARLGISRALTKYDQELKKILKSFGFMTRDSRKVERKKPGLKKARKSPQWQKR